MAHPCFSELCFAFASYSVHQRTGVHTTLYSWWKHNFCGSIKLLSDPPWLGSTILVDFTGWSLDFTVVFPTLRCAGCKVSHDFDLMQSLLLLGYMLRNGAERVVTSGKEHLFDLKSLEHYKFMDEVGKDQGINGTSHIWLEYLVVLPLAYFYVSFFLQSEIASRKSSTFSRMILVWRKSEERHAKPRTNMLVFLPMMLKCGFEEVILSELMLLLGVTSQNEDFTNLFEYLWVFLLTTALWRCATIVFPVTLFA